MKWSNEEINLLTKHYNEMSDEALVKILPNRTKSSISTKRKELGLLREQNRKYSFIDVINEFSKYDNYVLLSSENEYVNCCSKMRYLCKKHSDKGEQQISLNHLKNGRGCYYCGRERTESAHIIELDKENDKSLCEEKGFIYIDTIRKNGKITIVFICKKHIELGEQYMTKKNMERDIKGCKYCFGKDLPKWYVLQKINEINPYIKLLEPYSKFTKRMECLCTKHNYSTKKSAQEIFKGQGCYYCGLEKLSKQQLLSNKQVQKNISILNPHVKLISYKGNKEPSDFYCTIHNKYFNKYYGTLINCSSGCEECYAENIRSRCGMGEKEFKNRLNETHPELVLLGKYINNSTPLEVYCTKHDYTFSSTPVALLDRTTCCDKTRITHKEEQVCKLLEDKWFFKITRQKTFEDCVDKRCLPFDIYLDEYNVLIEYQGEQHYKPIRYSSETQEDAVKKFEYTQKHDNIKRQYCKNNNIPLIEIPYWEFDDLEYYLFDKFVKLKIIKEIKHTV